MAILNSLPYLAKRSNPSQYLHKHDQLYNSANILISTLAILALVNFIDVLFCASDRYVCLAILFRAEFQSLPKSKQKMVFVKMKLQNSS